MVFNIVKVLPLNKYTDYYVNFLEKNIKTKKQKSGLTKPDLPKINAMLKWGVVKAVDITRAKDYKEKAVLLVNGHVEYN